jgi:hypothetical protein
MSDSPNSQIETTAFVALKHFQQEEAMLAEMLRWAREVRAGLLSGDLHAQQEAVREHFEPPTALREQRLTLRERIAADLNISVEEATLRRLADRAPHALRDRLMATHERLRTRFVEIDRLNRANAVLASYFIELIQRLLGDPSSQRPSAGRYSSSGEVLQGDNSKHSGLQIRC